MRIFINTPIQEDNEERRNRRIESLAERIRKHGDVPVVPSSEGVCESENVGINVSSVIEVCDAVLLDIGWKRDPACVAIYHTAVAFGKNMFFHTKEEYKNIREKYVL